MSNNKDLAGKITVTAKEALENYGFKLNDVLKFSDGKKVTVAIVEEFKKYQKVLADIEKEEAEDGEEVGIFNPPPHRGEPTPPISENKTNKKYICVFRIKEGGRVYLPKTEYDGENVAALLENNSIRAE